MSTKEIDRIYADVPASQKELLLNFRGSHAYRELSPPAPNWRYLASGQGDQCLVFLPGGFLSADMWFYPILKLEPNYRILTPDSYIHYGIYGMQAVCDGLIQLLDQEEIDRATLIGLSAGGGIAQYFLQAYPKRVAHVVLSHCGILRQDLGLAKRAERLRTVAKVAPLSFIHWLIKKQTTGEVPESSEWAAFEAAYFYEARNQVTREMVVRLMADAADTRRSFVENLGALQSWAGKVLILTSEDDSLSYNDLGQLQARYPAVETHVFHEGGHHTLFFFPEAYGEALQHFLDSVRPW